MQSFIGLPAMVPEILGGSLKTGKKSLDRIGLNGKTKEFTVSI